MNKVLEQKLGLRGRKIGPSEVCLFRKTIWKGQNSVYWANSGGIAGTQANFRQVEG